MKDYEIVDAARLKLHEIKDSTGGLDEAVAEYLLNSIAGEDAASALHQLKEAKADLEHVAKWLDALTGAK